MSEKELEMKNSDALIVVDVQNDFCSGGKLAVDNGQAVVPALNRWIKKAEAANARVYASRDFHPVEHISFKAQGGPWPTHCIQDSKGAAFHNDLELPDNAIIVTKGVRFDTDQNSAFDNTGLGFQLKNAGVKRLFIGGLALDGSVLVTVTDALKEGFGVVLLSDATLPVSKAEGEKALETIRQAGGSIYTGGTSTGLDFCETSPEFAEHARMNEFQDACDDGRGGSE